jgi:hypothetical protein
MAFFKIVVIAIATVLVIYGIRFLWLIKSLETLHIMICSKCINDMALLYVAEKYRQIKEMDCPSYEQFISACGDRIVKIFFNPFKWNKYCLLPDLQTAITLKREFEAGIITDKPDESILRADAFMEQLLHEEKRYIEKLQEEEEED